MILCKKNNFRYYGETSNLFSRISKHKSDLSFGRNEISNLQNDYNFYGKDVFEFTILYKGFEWKDTSIRRKKEKELINANKNICYNVKFEDSLLPKRNRKKKSGIYMIFCKKNSFVYYGQSSTVLMRLSKHKSNLSLGRHPNTKLQKDYDQFGKDAFEFKILFEGTYWENTSKRKKKETKLIIENPKCYNIFDSFSNRRGEKNPFFAKKHSELTKNLISSANKNPNDKLGKKIMIDKIIFPSIAEASRQTTHSPKYIGTRLKNPNDKEFLFLTEDTQYDSIFDRESVSNSINKKKRRSRKFQSEITKERIRNALKNIPKDQIVKKIMINGIIYASISEASRKTNYSRYKISQRLIDPNYDNWKYVTDD